MHHWRSLSASLLRLARQERRAHPLRSSCGRRLCSLHCHRWRCARHRHACALGGDLSTRCCVFLSLPTPPRVPLTACQSATAASPFSCTPRHTPHARGVAAIRPSARHHPAARTCPSDPRAAALSAACSFATRAPYRRMCTDMHKPELTASRRCNSRFHSSRTPLAVSYVAELLYSTT